MTTVRECVEQAFDKYSFTRGYPHGGTDTRDRAVNDLLLAISKIIEGEKKLGFDCHCLPFEGCGCAIKDYNAALSRIQELLR